LSAKDISTSRQLYLQKKIRDRDTDNMSELNIQRRTKPVFKLAAADDQEKFKRLPIPTGKYPYHLNINNVVTPHSDEKLIFQMAGDTGGYHLHGIKQLMVNEMAKQYTEATDEKDRPLFFFHLGDVVYNYGQAAEYYGQFFSPFKNYPAPIFAVAGNHDADIDPTDPLTPQSLDAFIEVFCDNKSRKLKLAGDTGRKSTIQPNVYWTLDTPLATIICLYSNVPRFGTITPDQQNWFIEELKAAQKLRADKAVIVCLHHSAYSADTNHGSSLRMQTFLNSAFETANVYPDAVFSGHVHNYQRFTKTYANGRVVPFIIAGAGGYDLLHRIAYNAEPGYPDDSLLFDGVRLENYCDYAHGFLKITIEKSEHLFSLRGDYNVISIVNDNESTSFVFDSFSIDLMRY
jgi:acid phosphatase type 7